MLGRGRQDVLAFLFSVAALVARFDAGLQGNAIGRRAGSIAPGMAERAAAELKHGIVAEDRNQRRRVPDVNAAGGDRKHAGHCAPILIEENAAAAVFLDVAITHQIDPAQGGRAFAFELADNRAGVQVIAAREPQALGQDTKMNPVLRMPVEHGM